MKSARRGRNTLDVEVTNVSSYGFWLLLGEKERFVSFNTFPWFAEASIAQLTNVKLPSPHHLHWPDLDVDLAVDSLDHPERYPLVSQAWPSKRLKRTAAAVREAKAAYVRTGSGRPPRRQQ